MDGSELLDRIETEVQTELSRLGSSKSLYADTDGEMDGDAVLAAASAAAASAAETFESWDGEVFSDAARRERDHYERIADERDGDEPGEPPAVVAELQRTDGDIERLGATIGWTLVTKRKSTQSSGFFTGQADPQTASVFRSFGEDYERIRENALVELETVCEDESECDRAASAAVAVIEAAYDEYVETLEALGMNPKPVC